MERIVLLGRNVTISDPVAFNTIQKVFTALAALPTLAVWAGVYYISPKERFSISNPYKHMRLYYAFMSGIMIGQLLGHALPNSIFYSNPSVPFLAATFGIVVIVAFLKLCRVYGLAKNQVVSSTQYEPIELFTYEGEETAMAELGREQFILDEDIGEFDNSSTQTEGNGQVMSAVTATLTIADASDIRWIRRRIFEIFFVTACFMVLCEGMYLSYNLSEMAPRYSIPAFYGMKIVQAYMLACNSVFAYNHKITRKVLFLTYYNWPAVIFAVICVLSTIPALLGVSKLEIAIIVESPIFGAVYEFFAGVLAAIAFHFISREEFSPTKKGEFMWLLFFGIGACFMWALGLVI